MRRTLTVAALAVSASISLSLPASALPPDCERYGDKPCILLGEIVHEYCDELHKLLLEPPPVHVC